MSEKNTGQQEVKRIGKRGLIIILAICVIAVACILFVALVPADSDRNEVADNKVSEIKDVQNIESPTLEDKIKENENKIKEDKTNDTEDVSEAQSVIEEAIENEKKISVAKPLAGEISLGFEIDKLVFNSTLNIWQTHPGVDIVPGTSADVTAAMAGEVIKIEKDPTMGIYVTLSHENNIITKYAGLEECKLEEGAKLQKGDVIGICGTPPFEADAGAHLHFEVWDGTKPVDPEKVFE